MSNVIEIRVPDIGDFKNVEIIEISVKQGQAIQPEDALITLETDKAAMEVPSPSAGVVKELKIKSGDKVSKGDLILLLETSDVSAVKQPDVVVDTPKEAPLTVQAPQEPAQTPSQPVVSVPIVPVDNKEVHAGPSVRRLANQLGVDLSKVTGTGRKNRLVTEDIHLFVKRALQEKTGGSSGVGIEPMPAIDFSQWGSVEEKPLNRIKKLSAKFLHRNWVSIPHVTQFDECDISELERFRKDNKNSAQNMGINLTPLAFIVKAVVSSLQAYPQFNSSLSTDGATLIMKNYYHIGVAVDTPNGLVVPVLRDVDKKGLFSIAKELGEVSQKARDGALKAQDMQGSCFSISSLGGIGGTYFTPIINAPDVAILGVSKAQMKPVYQGDQFVPKLMLPLSMSYDHRVIDGAEAARFVKHLCEQLEDIRKLLL